MMLKRFLPVILVMAAFQGACKKGEKNPEEVLPLESLPFGVSQAAVRERFERSGWKLQNETSEKSTFNFPSAVPEELRQLPVMGETGSPMEPYTINVYFNKGTSVIAILHRVDQTERLKSFQERLSKEYALPAFTMKERSEKTPAGNTLSESRGAAETASYVFMLLTAHITPAEQKLKDGMNDEMELRIFPRKFNEGITPQALMRD